MLNINQLKELIIVPTLEKLLMFSDDAVELMVFTCAVESCGGTYLKQIKGPALGIYQMEPRTYIDIWENYIKLKKNLLTILSANFEVFVMPDEERLIHDLRFATLMTRLHYARVKEDLPPANDVDAIWDYYKTYYNTYAGSAKKEASVQSYLKFRSSFKS